MKIKESTTATVLRILFTIGMVITLGISTIAGALNLTVFNTKNWEKFYHEKKVVEAFHDEFDDSFDELNLEYGIHIDAEDFAEETYDFIIPEYIEMLRDGDTELDDDRYDEYFDENIGEILEDEFDLPKSEIKDLKKDFREELEDKMEATADDMGDTLDSIFAFRDGCTATAIVCFVITLALFGILLPLHKNKYTPLRNLGIATIISQSLNALGFTGLWALIGAAMDEAAEEDIEEAIVDFWNKGTLPIFLGFTALIAVGIVILIIAINGKKRVDEEADADADGSDNAQPMQPVQPMPPVQPVQPVQPTPPEQPVQ